MTFKTNKQMKKIDPFTEKDFDTDNLEQGKYYVVISYGETDQSFFHLLDTHEEVKEMEKLMDYKAFGEEDRHLGSYEAYHLISIVNLEKWIEKQNAAYSLNLEALIDCDDCNAVELIKF